jgi:hypothetical protein
MMIESLKWLQKKYFDNGYGYLVIETDTVCGSIAEESSIFSNRNKRYVMFDSRR